VAVKNGFFSKWACPDQSYNARLDRLGILKEKMIYQPERYQSHAQELLEALVYNRLEPEDLQYINTRFPHTCCRIGKYGQLEDWNTDALKDNASLAAVEEDFHRLLDACALRMAECKCPTPEKPVCAVYRETCGSLGEQQCS
jgi:hypothetical protein